MEGKMPLIKVQVRKNIHPRQIEFGNNVERSKPGALYFVPGAVKTITLDEYNWIEKYDKIFFRFLIVLPSDTEKNYSKRKTKIRTKTIYKPKAVTIVEENNSKTAIGSKSIPDKKGNE
jgi:hypothetical protein